MTLTPALAETLALVAGAAADAIDPWWIIGSAAVALHGGAVAPRDVDLLMSAADAEAFLRRVGEAPRAGELDERFRSTVFGTWTVPLIPVEVMGGFAIAVAGAWREVRLSTRETVRLPGGRVYIPSADELARLLDSFGRPKDLERARLLRDRDAALSAAAAESSYRAGPAGRH